MRGRAGAVIPRRLARVDLVCDVHHGGEAVGSQGTLTTVGGRWAYCRSPRIVGHRWVETGGVPVTRLLPERRSA